GPLTESALGFSGERPKQSHQQVHPSHLILSLSLPDTTVRGNFADHGSGAAHGGHGGLPPAPCRRPSPCAAVSPSSPSPPPSSPHPPGRSCSTGSGLSSPRSGTGRPPMQAVVGTPTAGAPPPRSPRSTKAAGSTPTAARSHDSNRRPWS